MDGAGDRVTTIKVALQMFWDSIYGAKNMTDLVMVRFVVHAYYRAGHIRVKDYVRVMKWANKREITL
jgi:hypothetical protein